MNIYPEILVQKTYKNRRKPGLNLNYLQTEPITEAKNTFLLRHKLLNMNKNDNLNKYKSFYFDKAINNYITPNENYYDESYNSQINRDIYGYNNYIINKNNYNTINFTSKKNSERKIDNNNNHNYTYQDSPNYLTAYESSSDLYKILKNSSNNQAIKVNTNSSFYNNYDIRFMNMKLNFKILEKKLSHLKDIASSTDKNYYQTPYKMPYYATNINSSSNDFSENNQPIKVFRSANINNLNHKLIKKVKGAKKKIKVDKKNEETYNLNNNIKINKNNESPMHSNSKNKLFNIKKENKNEINLARNRYYTNDNSLNKYSKKDESELSEIADHLLAIKKNKSIENSENIKKDKPIEYLKLKYKSNNPSNKKNLIQNININIKNKNNNNKYKFISNELEEISINKGNNYTENNNEQNLMIEHIFSYNSTQNGDNKKEINSSKYKNNKAKNNKNINIVQTNNFLITDLKEKKIDKNEVNKNNNIEIKNGKAINKNNDKDFSDENENNDDDYEDKIINSLIATASNKFKNGGEDNGKINTPVSEFDNDIAKENKLDNGKHKHVTFDDNLIYINYHQDYKATNLKITDNDDKCIQFKPKDISKIIKNLSKEQSELKPVIIESNRENYNNIINKIKIMNINNKINKNKTRKIIQKNKDLIKEIEKRGKLKSHSKDKSKNKNKVEKKKDTINNINIKNINIKKMNIPNNNNKKISGKNQ